MLFGYHSRNNSLSLDIEVTRVDGVSEIKFLGVIDENISWKLYTNSINSKVKKIIIALLYKLKDSLKRSDYIYYMILHLFL